NTNPAPAEVPSIIPLVPASSDNLIQIAFLLDTSNSMDGLIDQAKARLWGILNEIIRAKRDGEPPRIEVALYEYGNDGLPEKDNYIRQVSPLTTDVDAFSDQLFKLTTNGGSEYCGAVLERSFGELSWSNQEQAVKLIYIAGNEPFTQGAVDPYAIINAGCEKDLTVTTIYCGDPTEGRRTGWHLGQTNCAGEFFHIDQNQATVYIESPYDDAIEEANQSLNRTYIPYGTQGAELMVNQTRQDANAATYSKANLSSRAKYKASSNYTNEHWDLVDAYDKDAEVIDKKEMLPDSLAQLDDEALRDRIAVAKERRAAAQAEIKRLSELRDQYVAEEKTRAANDPEENSLGAR
ncbi:MAG: vWA domain-containing protein, partial [Bacteroidota bacterium]